MFFTSFSRKFVSSFLTESLEYAQIVCTCMCIPLTLAICDCMNCSFIKLLISYKLFYNDIQFCKYIIYNLNLNDGYNLKSALRFFSRKIVLETKILRMSDILIVSG